MCVATYRLARVYFAREEWEKAAELFQTASDDPSCGSQEASLYLMKTRMQQGLADDARRARDACLKLSPQSCIASQCRADGGALGRRAADGGAARSEAMERRDRSSSVALGGPSSMIARMSLALWLRAGRAQRGLSLEDVAHVTKIQPRILERLESGRLDGLPADVFVRGFVRSFARCVGLDEDEALQRYGACAPTSLVAPTSSAAATAAARALVEAMADLAPMMARAVPASRAPLASGSLSDLPRAAAVETIASAAEALEAPAEVIAPAEVVAPAESETPRPIYQDRAAHAAVAVEAAVAVAVEAAVAVVAEAAAEPAPAAPKKRARKSAGGGKSRGKRKPLATGTPAEASPVIEADAAAPASEVTAAPVKRSTRARTNGAAAAAVAAPTTDETAAAPAKEAASAPAQEAAAAPAQEADDRDRDRAGDRRDGERARDRSGERAGDDRGRERTGDRSGEPRRGRGRPARCRAGGGRVRGAARAAGGHVRGADRDGDVAPPVPEAVDGLDDEPAAVAAAAADPPPASTSPAVPSLVIDDADPESAERVLEERAAAKSVLTSAQRRSFLPPILLDREDRSARQGGLTLAVIILLIAATLTLSYLMRRPSSSGDGVTQHGCAGAARRLSSRDGRGLRSASSCARPRCASPICSSCCTRTRTAACRRSRAARGDRSGGSRGRCRCSCSGATSSGGGRAASCGASRAPRSSASGRSLASDVVAVAHASYVAELVGALLPPEAPEPHALDVIVALWDSLAEGGPSPGALRAVELALLDLAGHRPALDRVRGVRRARPRDAARCSIRRAAARSAGAAPRTSRGPGVRPIEPATRAYLRAVLELESPSAARAVDADPRFQPADRTAARDALVAMMSGLVGRPLRSLEYLAKLGAAQRRGD